MATIRERQEALAAQKIELDAKKAAMLRGLADLQYPVSKDGSVLDVSAFKAIVVYHLIRCGWRPDESKREIKSRKVIGNGVIADAVEWVAMDAPDDPLDNLANMTLAEINALAPGPRAAAIARLGGTAPEIPENPGWHVRTNIQITDDPDEPDDGLSWVGNVGEHVES
jgi:hypothetical protein